MGKVDLYFPDEQEAAMRSFCERTGRTMSGWIQILVSKELKKEAKR